MSQLAERVISEYLSEGNVKSLAKLASKKSGPVAKEMSDEIWIDFETEKKAEAFASAIEDDDSYDITSKMVGGKHRLEIEVK